MDDRDLKLPEKMHVERGDDSLTIIRELDKYPAIFTTGITIVWYVIIIIIYNQKGFTNITDIPWIFTVLAICLSYVAIGRWINKTKIEVTKLQLKISHGPLPWTLTSKIATSDIKQLYVKEERIRTNITDGEFLMTYDLHTIDKVGEDEILIMGLNSNEQALYLEQEIKKYLGIENQVVPDEGVYTPQFEEYDATIKEFAKTKWPNDPNMQAKTIETQTVSFYEIYEYCLEHADNEIFGNSYYNAACAYPKDYEMQLKILEEQMESANEFVNFTPPDTVTEDAWREIFLDVFYESSSDYNLLLPNAEKRVKEWLSTQ